MRLNALKRTIYVLSALLVVAIAIGQDCSGMETIAPTVGVSVSGNGGGYGGLRSDYQGRYDRTQTGEGDPAPLYLVGSQTGCSSYPAGWEAVGPLLTGIIRFTQSTASYAASACGPEIPISPKAPVSVSFNSSVAVYSDDIYIRLRSQPPLVSDLVTPVAYCTNVQKSQPGSDMDVGTDVFVYNKAGQIYATITEGHATNDALLKYSVAPFAVVSSNNGLQTTFSFESFALKVANSGGKTTTAAYSVILDGAQVNMNMSCFIHP